MVIIKTEDWGNFEANFLEQAKDEFVNAIVSATSNPDISIEINEINYHGDLLAKCYVKNIERDIEYRVKKWHETAKIERAGYIRAQQEAMEG